MTQRFAKGSEWRKWDLHVHTPASFKNGYSGQWERFLNEIEALPREFAVLGINDYLFLDGFKRLKLEKEKNGRLKNIETLFPVVEFRIKKFAGVEFRDTKRVNLHVIFDPDLAPDLIEAQFLNRLQSSYSLQPGIQGATWSGVVTKESLEALGKQIKENVPKDKLHEYHSDLEEGFNNLNVDEDELIRHLSTNTFLKDKYLIGIGKSEWDKIAWDNSSIAEKKDILNKAHVIFTASDSVNAFQSAKNKLITQCVNNLLLHCSDAHNFSDSKDKDRLGHCFTWIKADPTFEGLRQLLTEGNNRCWVGVLPPKLDRLENNKTKFISAVNITRKSEAKIPELWFQDITLPLNPDLVAIIGNKGKGKSALTDIIGLLANTKQHENFTFLSERNFCQLRDNKSKHFKASITWVSGQTTTKGLDESVDEQQPELIKYIPQNFLEKICTEIGSIEKSDFDQELKNVIFSHVEKAERLGKQSLEELLSYKTSEAASKILLLKQELNEINIAIIELEDRSAPEYKARLQNFLRVKQEELEALENSPPKKEPKPENDSVTQKEISEIAKKVEAKKGELEKVENEIEEAKRAQASTVQHLAAIEKLLSRLENLDRTLSRFSSESDADFEQLGIKEKEVFQYTIDKSPLTKKQEDISQAKLGLDSKLDVNNPESLIQAKVKVLKVIKDLQANLDEPNKRYQAYEQALQEWQKRKESIVGTPGEEGTIKHIEGQLKNLSGLPDLLKSTRKSRVDKAKEIHRVIRELANTYRELYAPVNRFIENQPMAKEKFLLNFEVAIVESGFQQQFFEIISHGASGSFCGIEEGVKMLKSIFARNDLNTEAGIESFFNDLVDALEMDKRADGKQTRVQDQLRKGKTVLALYDLIFGLDFLRPKYELRMGDKELSQLSPGERGTLLLVFYLLVDKDDIPLVIDQPEENLDNQTVYELLVPCIKEAKKRRQIFIVTHNPNLAVVCDAEQIIVAELDKKQNYRMQYTSGSIENPVINKKIVDVLEGTRPAFDNRDSKYSPSME